MHVCTIASHNSYLLGLILYKHPAGACSNTNMCKIFLDLLVEAHVSKHCVNLYWFANYGLGPEDQ